MKGKIISAPNLTPLEAILKGNNERKVIAPNYIFNRILLEKDKNGDYKEIQKDLLACKPWYTGNAFVMEGTKVHWREATQFGKTMEFEFEYKDKLKIAVIEINEQYRGIADLIVLQKHGFRIDGEPNIQVSDKFGKRICSLDEADEIFVKFSGNTYAYKFKERNQGLFEMCKVGEDSLLLDATQDPAFSLLGRGASGGPSIELLNKKARTWTTALESNEPRGVLFLD